MAHHKTEKKSKGMESKSGKLKIHGGFKMEDEKMGGKKEHKSEHKK